MRAALSTRGSVAAAAFALLASVLMFAPIAGQQGPVPAAYVPDEILVRFRPEASVARRDAAVSAMAGTVLKRFGTVGVVRARLRPGTSVAAAMALAQADPDVLAAQPNYIRYIDASAPPNDPYWVTDNLWGMVRIQASAAWNGFTTGTAAVVVADIDTGVNYFHPDLAANIWRNPGEIPGNGIDDDGNGYVDDVYGIDTLNVDSDPMDDNGHGTHTAGIVGAAGNNGIGVVGVNWRTSILACKAFDAAGRGTDAEAIECFDYIVALKNRGVNIRVSTNSWGTLRYATSPAPLALRAAVDAAGAAGILNVCAAGNDGMDIDVTPFEPASFTSASVVAVAASTNTDDRATFSNYGATSVDLAAPGVAIASTYGSGYALLTGTSMATPHVAGAAALLLARQPSLSVAALKSLLIGNVDPLPQWSGLVVSAGRLNVYKAMLAIAPNTPPSVALTGPNDGASFTAPATVTIAATASDSDGTVARVDFVVNGSVAASDTSAPYSVTLSGLGAGTYAFSAIATDNAGATAASTTRTFTVMPPAGGGTASATFVSLDAVTQGSWKGVYGADGYVIVGDTTSLPSYAQVTSAGQSAWTWAASTGDVRALQRVGSDRVAAAWYAGVFTIDVNITGTQPRQLALYALDFDGAARQQRVDLLDAATGAPLDSRTISAFSNGMYLVWNILGHVSVKVTSLSGPNAVVSGILLGGSGSTGGGGSGGTAAFVAADGATQGTWKGHYGSDGYVIAGDATSLPADTQAAVSGQSTWTWAASTTDVRALQRASSDRVMAAWFGAAFTIDLNVGSAAPRQVAIYSADYDNGGRQQRFDLFDGATNTLLDTRTLSAFSGGAYLLWNVQGHVKVQVTRVSGANAVVSGILIGPGAAGGSGASAVFLRGDATTQGQWKGVYGADGYALAGDVTSLPADARLTFSGASSWTWAASTSDLRALQRAGADRVMAAWFAGSLTLDLDSSSAPVRQLAIYAADYDQAGRRQRFDLFDAATGALLDSRTMSDFVNGQYFVWDIQGHLTIRVTTLAGPNAVVSGVFFR